MFLVVSFFQVLDEYSYKYLKNIIYKQVLKCFFNVLLNNFTIPILCIDIYTKLKHCVLLKLCALTSLDLWKCTPKDIATPKARNSENNNFWNLHKSEIYPLICRSRQFMKTLSNCILIRNRRVLVEIFEVKGEGRLFWLAT